MHADVVVLSFPSVQFKLGNSRPEVEETDRLHPPLATVLGWLGDLRGTPRLFALNWPLWPSFSWNMEGRQWSLIFFLLLALASSHNGHAILKYTKQHPTYTYFYGGWCPHDVFSPYVYGYGFCRKELSSNDCGDCIDAAKDSLFRECTNRVGAQVELQDCGIRYENYKFMDYPY
ncbi:hypothetical protein MLD38_004806 [Melastoma candidum]|uniref:Uncharacterized protein n=1 Tax=Melastoma candidum TaxID=119954 RepID=A0ACB9SFI0_9MYRT|nr:hypothetical protein MLD38_004806 [Melastoma candidum]